MDKGIFYRLAGNSCMFLLLTSNVALLFISMNKHLRNHPEFRLYESLSFRYATVWNLMVQILYSALAFVCDFYTVQNKEKKIPPAIRKFRFRIFHEIVFPNCFGVAVFWPIFFYNRELIFPVAVEIITSKWQNILVHGVIFAYVAWEMTFLPQVLTRNEIRITPVVGMQIAYIVNVLYTKYIHPGAWVYDILGYLEDSYMFYVVFFGPLTFTVLAFHTQWAMRDSLCKYKDIKLKNY